MVTRESIFGSDSEHNLFQTINSRWGDRFRIYPSLPFANIIDVTRLNLKPAEREFLLKTSVDFTLCTRKQAQPLLSIDFDGMCRGFGQNGRYIPMQTSNDPYRELKLDLKVRKATQAGYPLFVISYDEKIPIGRDIHLTIVDGIIGLVLARKQFDYNIGELARSFSEIYPDEMHMNWDWVPLEAIINADRDAHFKWNPIIRAEAEASYRAWAQGVAKSHEYEFLTDPVNKAHRVGCRATVHTSFGDVIEVAWIRNIEHAGISVFLLVKEIALLLAFRRTLALSESSSNREHLSNC